MSNVQQQFRDSIEIGKPIGVLLRWGNQERLVPALVLEVVRAAARVRFDDGTERLIHFKMLRHMEKPKANGHAPTDRPTPRPVPALPVQTTLINPASPYAQKPSTPPAPTQANDELSAWVQMGRDLLAPIETEISQLRAEGEALDAELEAIEDRRGEIVERLKTLHQKRESIAKLVKLVDEEDRNGK